MFICNDPHLVRIFGISLGELKLAKLPVFVIMEKMQFELQALIFGDNKKGIQKRKFSIEEKRSILLMVLKGLQKLHSQQFVHCDMKW